MEVVKWKHLRCDDPISHITAVNNGAFIHTASYMDVENHSYLKLTHCHIKRKGSIFIIY